jgi:hypothetical protein
VQNKYNKVTVPEISLISSTSNPIPGKEMKEEPNGPYYTQIGHKSEQIEVKP